MVVKYRKHSAVSLGSRADFIRQKYRLQFVRGPGLFMFAWLPMFELIIGLVKETNCGIASDVFFQRWTSIFLRKQSLPLLYCVFDLIQLHTRKE